MYLSEHQARFYLDLSHSGRCHGTIFLRGVEQLEPGIELVSYTGKSASA
jgi:hypothetical protein